MRIRTQLVLACFLLSIVPLSGIVLYSYRSSREALESAYRSEATRATKQMDRRLTAIRGELEQRLAELSMFPLRMTSDAPAADMHMATDVMTALGDSARLLDSVEIRPMAPKPPVWPKHASRTVRASPALVAPPAVTEPPPAIPPVPGDVHVMVRTDVAGAATPIVIGIPESVPHVSALGMSAAQQKKLHELGQLAKQFASGAATMSKEERASLEKQMDELQSAFSRDMEESQKTFAEKLNASLKANEQQRKIELSQRLAAARVQRKAAQRTEAPAAAAEERASAAAAADANAATEVAVESAAESADTSSADPMPTVVRRDVSADDSARMREHQKRVTAIFGRELSIPVRRNGAVVANLSAQVRLEEVIRRVLGGSSEDGEISFAVDRDGNLYTRSKADRQTLDSLGVSKAVISGAPLPKLADWIVALSKDAQSGVRIGVMRPCSTDLAGLRRAAAVNFSAGIALIVVALIGIVPVANHISRDVKLVTAGAERIALGDLTTRVPVTSHNEFGQLATAFNKMAADLSQHQQTIVEQERTRKEQELQQRMLAMEYSRKSVELEEARRFQLSMLPKDLPANKAFDVAVSTETATEVGGDYYDFHVSPTGALTIAVGDATGHGAKAGTMITVAKTLFSSYSAEIAPAAFLRDAADKIKRMDFTRMAMSLLLARFEPGRMTVAAAGMPPTLIGRANGTIDEIALESTPLGTLGTDYTERVIELSAGDTVLFMTDGLPELLNGDGQQLGYPAALDAFAAAASEPDAAAVIASLATFARSWRGGQAPNDDITFVVVRAA